MRRTQRSEERIIHSVNVNGIRCKTVSIKEFCDTLVDEKTGEAIVI